MAQRGVPTGHKIKATELELIVDGWERRHEWRLLSKTVPRSLIAALLISLVVGIAGYLRFRLSAEQLALITAGVCAAGGILNVLYTLVFPRPLSVRARYFDLEFDLRERISTAFELMHGRIMTHPEIESRQIADALKHARAIEPRARIHMDFRPRELAALLFLSLVMLGLLVLPAFVDVDLIADATSAAVEAAREDLREIIEAVATDTDLDDIDRQDLLDALEVALERLQEEDISEEEAFAAMSQLAAELEEMDNKLGDTVELDQSTAEAALDALKDFIPPSETENANADSSNQFQAPPDDLLDLSQTLESMAQGAQEMSPEEAAAAAQALQNAAEALSQMNDELSRQLDEMSEALENADAEALQESLEAARAELAREEQQRQQGEEARAMLQEQSEQAQESAEAIARQQAQEGQGEQSESGQQRGGQQSDQARQGANQGNQSPETNRPGAAENMSRSQDSRSSGGGAGEGAPSNESLPGSAGEDQGADTNNRTTGQAEIQYEALYSPSGIGGGGQEEIQLETDASDTTLKEGDFDDNPLGESRVSYDTVFSEYQNAANRALESDYVPLGLRDVVREYFTSLEPGAE